MMIEKVKNSEILTRNTRILKNKAGDERLIKRKKKEKQISSKIETYR